jgi:hypothetical protein
MSCAGWQRQTRLPVLTRSRTGGPSRFASHLAGDRGGGRMSSPRASTQHLDSTTPSLRSFVLSRNPRLPFPRPETRPPPPPQHPCTHRSPPCLDCTERRRRYYLKRLIRRRQPWCAPRLTCLMPEEGTRPDGAKKPEPSNVGRPRDARMPPPPPGHHPQYRNAVSPTTVVLRNEADYRGNRQNKQSNRCDLRVLCGEPSTLRICL